MKSHRDPILMAPVMKSTCFKSANPVGGQTFIHFVRWHWFRREIEINFFFQSVKYVTLSEAYHPDRLKCANDQKSNNYILCQLCMQFAKLCLLLSVPLVRHVHECDCLCMCRYFLIRCRTAINNIRIHRIPKHVCGLFANWLRKTVKMHLGVCTATVLLLKFKMWKNAFKWECSTYALATKWHQ